jgi:hypothetical protein
MLNGALYADLDPANYDFGYWPGGARTITPSCDLDYAGICTEAVYPGIIQRPGPGFTYDCYVCKCPDDVRPAECAPGGIYDSGYVLPDETTGDCPQCTDTCFGFICVQVFDRCTGLAVPVANIQVDGVSCGFSDTSGELCCQVSCTTHTLQANTAMQIQVWPDPPTSFTVTYQGQIVYRTLWMEPLAGCGFSACPPGEYWCDGLGDCIVAEAQCEAELNCEWNPVTCAFDCDEPEDICAPDEQWNETDCVCVPCEPGECWCEGVGNTLGTVVGSGTALECGECPPVSCKDELLCYWDRYLCDWVCHDPYDPADALYCGAGMAWDWLTCQCRAETEGDGVDLAQQATGHVFRSYKTAAGGGVVAVDITRDKGVTWEAVTVASDAAGDAVPTLVVDRHDHVYVWYHTNYGINVYRSTDDGITWTLHTNIIGLEYPRPDLGADGLYFAAIGPGGLRIYYTADYGLTLTLLATLADVPRQLAQFRVDKHGHLHVAYRGSGGELMHTSSGDDGTWSTPAQYSALTGNNPTLALGPTYRGLLAYWGVLDVLTLWSTEAAPDALREEDTSTTTGYAPLQWLGVLVDEEDTLWLCGRLAASSALAVYQSHGAAFVTPS